MLGIRILLVILFLPVFAFAEDVCFNCHGAGSKNEDAQKVDMTRLENSVHAELGCSDCHTVNPKENHKGVNDVICGKCHESEANSYAKSPHMEGRTVSLELVPDCITCHGGHDILNIADKNSKTNHLNSVKICEKCHTDKDLVSKFDILPEPTMIVAYENSIHGKALLKDGNMDAPACVDCHGSHSFLPADKLDSPLNKIHIAETCGKCHGEIANTYNESIHGKALAEGLTESPTCTDCHGEHDIRAHLDPESKVFTTNIPTTCSECHASEEIVGKLGLKPERIETFKESFHGIANELGEGSAANCASCHGVHNIFPQDDPRSMINKDRIHETCGQCHDDLPDDFVEGQVHTSADDETSGGKFYVRKFYYIFIPILIVGFIIYRILEYKRRAQRVEK